VKNPIVIETKFSQRMFEESSNIKFYQNLSIGNLVVPCGRTEGQTDGWKNLTMVLVAFCSFSNAAKKETNNIADYVIKI
jgi:hypothetical protein